MSFNYRINFSIFYLLTNEKDAFDSLSFTPFTPWTIVLDACKKFAMEVLGPLNGKLSCRKSCFTWIMLRSTPACLKICKIFVEGSLSLMFNFADSWTKATI